MPYAHTSAAGRTIRNCEEVFRRVHRKNRGKKSIVGGASASYKTPACSATPERVLESTLEQVTVAAINNALSGKDDFLAILEQNIATVLRAKSDNALIEIDGQLEDLQMQLVKLTNSKSEYDKVGDEIYRLRDEKQKVQLEIIRRDELKKRIADMGEFLREQPTAITEYDEPLVRRLIEKVIVYEDKFAVEFKSGVNVEIID